MGTVFQTVTPYSRTIRRQSPALRRIASPDGDDGRAGREHPENIVYGKVEIERGHGKACVTLAHMEPPLMSAIVFRALRCSIATPLGSPWSRR